MSLASNAPGTSYTGGAPSPPVDISRLLFGADRDNDYAGYLSRRLPPLATTATPADQALYQELQRLLGIQLAAEYRDESGLYTGPEEFRQYHGVDADVPALVQRLQYGDLSPVNLAASGQAYGDPGLETFAQGQIHNANLQDQWSFLGDQFSTALLGLGLAVGGAALYGGFGAAGAAGAGSAGSAAGGAAADLGAPVALGVGGTAAPAGTFAAGAGGAAADLGAPVALGVGGTAAPAGTFAATGAGAAGGGLGSLVGPAINAGTDILGRVITGNAVSDATNTQAEAGRQANQLLRDLYNQQRQDQLPFYQAGVAALPQLAALAGTAPTAPLYAPPAPLAPEGYGFTPPAPLAPEGYRFTPPAPLAPEGYGFTPPTADTLVQDPGYQFRLREGTKTLERSASARGTTLSGGQQKALTTYAQESASQEFQNAYQRALRENELRYGRALTANQQGYERGLAANQQDYGRALTANQQGYDRGLAANQLTYGRAVAANEQEAQRRADAFTTNFNVQNTLQNQHFNRLSALAGLGQTSSNTLNNVSGQYGAQAAQILQGIGNVQAAGQVGTANALAGGVGAIGQAAQQFQAQQLLRQLLAQIGGG